MPEADTFEWPQGQPLFDVQWRAVTEGLIGNGVKDAGDFEVTATANNRETNVAAGTAFYIASETSLGSAVQNTHSVGDSSNDRWDTVAWDTATSSVVVREGTPSATPEPPDLTGDEILLAVVYVPQNFDAPFSDADHIFNWRGYYSNEAEHVHFDDSTGVYGVDNVDAALDELQEAAQTTAYPLALATDTDMDVSGTDLTDAGTVLYESVNAFFRNEVIQALTNFTSDEQFSAYPLIIGTDVAAHLAGSDLLDASGGNTVYDNTEDHVPRARVDDELAVTTETASGTNTGITTSDEEAVLVDTATNSQAFTVTLASADAVAGNRIRVSDIGGGAQANNITIATEGGETIDGETSITIDKNYGSKVLMSDGTNWKVVASLTQAGRGPWQHDFSGAETGNVPTGDQGQLVVSSLADQETVEIYLATLVLDTVEAAPSSLTLELVTYDNAGGFSSQATLISGDGSTIHDKVTGNPLASYQNTTGSPQSIGVLADNQTAGGVDIVADVEGRTGL